MSGDISRAKQRKAGAGGRGASKAKLKADENGSKSRLRKEMNGSSAPGGASLITKLVFYLLLAALGVSLTVVYVDYQPGQLKGAYEKYIPPEVTENINIRFAVGLRTSAASNIDVLSHTAARPVAHYIINLLI